MDKIAFVFPGQGSHFIGMGKTLSEQFPIAKQTFEEAGDTLGFDLAKLCFEGSLSELNRMKNMFPALLANGIASFRVYIREVGVLPQLCAGHSLGEYTALTCAGVIKYPDALKIVHMRGRLTQEVADSGIGVMTIIDGVDGNTVEEMCRQVSMREQWAVISCYNSPRQFAVSGHPQAVMDVEDRVLEAGGQISPLIGGAPFHSPLMEEAADMLCVELGKYTYSPARYPVLSNVTGRLYPETEKVIETLSRQLTCPVQWQASMRSMQRYGITIAVEMGPKNVLSSLVAANTSGIQALCFGQREDKQLLKEVLASGREPGKAVIARCLAAAAATPNANWDHGAYEKGVLEPYRSIQQMQYELEEAGAELGVAHMRRALEMLRIIFATKKLPVEEQTEWFGRIIDETGTNDLFSDFIDRKL